jgi:hypothetical protein
MFIVELQIHIFLPSVIHGSGSLFFWVITTTVHSLGPITDPLSVDEIRIFLLLGIESLLSYCGFLETVGVMQIEYAIPFFSYFVRIFNRRCLSALCVVERTISNILQDVCASQSSPITYTCNVEKSRQEISSIFTRITSQMLHVVSDIELP